MDVIKSALPRRPESMDRLLSPSSYPVFLPHVTLATVPSSSLGVPHELLDAVPENQKQIPANFRSLAVGDHYFRSVLIDLQSTQELTSFQDQILTNLRRRGLEPNAPRFPHMSLCYIVDEDRGERDRMAQLLRDTAVIKQTADPGSISLRCEDVNLTGFDGAEIWMVNCDGRVEDWKAEERKIKLTADSQHR